nr:hypothetical protein [Tanacetum cinerariifolium]
MISAVDFKPKFLPPVGIKGIAKVVRGWFLGCDLSLDCRECEEDNEQYRDTVHCTLDSLGKFDGKVDEGFLVGYFVSSKAFRVFNSRTRIVQETLHVNFLENKPNVAGNQSSPSAGIQEQFDVEKAGEEIEQQYVLFPVWFSGSTNPHYTDGDFAFDEKELEFEGNKPESEVNVSPSSSAQSKKHDDKTKREAKGKKLEDITYSDDEDDVGTEAYFNNLETSITVSPIPTKRVNKDHLVTQIIGLGLSRFAVWKRAICTKWVFRNKKDERAILVRNKSRLVAQGHTQEEGIDYEEVFAPIARIKSIRLFLAYASFMGFMVYHMDVKSAFLYGTIEEEVYVCQPPGFKDPDYPDKDPDGREVDVHTYRSMISSLTYLTSSRPNIMFAVCACAHFHVTLKASHIHAVKRIFRYLKGKPYLGLWYLKDSPFDLVAYSNSDYAGASLDRKSTTGGCQFLRCRLVSWQCKKQIVMATSSTEAEYVAAASCCAQVLWI